MEKIGKSFKFFLLVALFFNAFQLKAKAQDNLSVKAVVSDATVFTGDRIKLSIIVNGDFAKMSLPNLAEVKGFRLITPTPSTSRQFSYINGVTKTSYTYSYYLVAQEKGTYLIPPVTIQIDGEQYQTQPVKVTVTERSAESGASAGGANVFLRMKISDRTVVPGEQITANVVLYFKNDVKVSTYQPIPGWKAKGFWKEQLKTSSRPEVKSTIINGMRYNKARLLQFALFPTKPGQLTISPYQVNVLVHSAPDRGNPFSSFFGSFDSNRRRLQLKTDPVTVEVHSLPEPDRSSFIGAVGSFNIRRTISADTVRAGETIEIKTTVSGTGNIPLLTKPDYKLPEKLEVYRPQTSMEINRTGTHISGRKTFTDIVVPRNPGAFTIPAETLSWYSTEKDTFIKEKLPAKTIFVKASLSLNTNAGRSKEPMISPITGLVNWISPSAEKNLINYWWFWAGVLLPVAGLIAGYWRKTYNEKMSSNYSFARSKQAKEKADKRLKQAINHAESGQINEAYHYLQKALTGFIGDKLNMAEAGLSIEQYIQALEDQHVDRDLIKNVKMLLNKCATINYAPKKSSDFLRSHAGLAESIIKKLKRVL